MSYSLSLSSNGTNVYLDLEIINPTNNVLDLGIFMSGDCSFKFHIKVDHGCIFSDFLKF